MYFALLSYFFPERTNSVSIENDDNQYSSYDTDNGVCHRTYHHRQCHGYLSRDAVKKAGQPEVPFAVIEQPRDHDRHCKDVRCQPKGIQVCKEEGLHFP